MSLRKVAVMTGAVIMLAIPAFSSADFSYDFNNVVTGATPSGPAPWANLTGTQNGSDVDFVLTFNDFVGPNSDTEFLNNMDVQYSGDLSGTSMLESEAGIVGFDVDGHTDASIHFDAIVDFNNPNNGNRIKPGDTVSFTLTNVDADNFSMFMLHINGIGEGSSKVNNAVPEPASMAALGLGAFGLLARRRRNKK